MRSSGCSALWQKRCWLRIAGLPVALPRVARFLLVPPVVLPRVARFLLAPPVVLCAGSFRVARRSYCASTASVLPPVYRAPAASVSCAGLPRADSFRIVRRSTARRQLPYCRRSLAVRFLGGAAQSVRAQISIGIWLSHGLREKRWLLGSLAKRCWLREKR